MSESAAHTRKPKTGVLLVNLGTPAAPTASAIRRYLRQFLSDRRVVELPRVLWWPLLYGLILPFRPQRLVRAYKKVWTAQGSPLMVNSRAQREALALRLGTEIEVALAMTYGEPSIESALAQLEDANVRRVLLLPLYPQYSGTTTAAVFDALSSALRRQRWLPDLRTVNSYHDDAGYVDALTTSLRAHWAAQGRGDHLLISFHSIPRRYVQQGDPYFCHCQKTARLLAERLGLTDSDHSVSFQSRLGRQPWLMPYTDQVIPQLARRGVKSLDVICPGFAADCLETLEEVAIRYAALFIAAGGAALRYVPALNDSAPHLDALEKICRRHLQGWAPGDTEDAAQRATRVETLRPSLDSPLLLK